MRALLRRVDRGERDDRPAAGCRERGDRMLRGEEETLQVRVEDEIPVGLGEVGRLAVAGDAGAGGDGVEPSPLAHGRRDGRLDVRARRDVARVRRARCPPAAVIAAATRAAPSPSMSQIATAAPAAASSRAVAAPIPLAAPVTRPTLPGITRSGSRRRPAGCGRPPSRMRRRRGRSPGRPPRRAGPSARSACGP